MMTRTTIVLIRILFTLIFALSTGYGLFLAFCGVKGAFASVGSGDAGGTLGATIFLSGIFFLGAIFCGIASFYMIQQVLGDLRNRRPVRSDWEERRDG